MNNPFIDFIVSNHGSIWLLNPLSEPARAWVEEHLPEDRQHFGVAVVIEHRYVHDIAQGIRDDGLVVRS